jgi:hypothetical protein
MSEETLSMEEFMVKKLGGEEVVVSEYLREVAGLNKAGGAKKTLGEILDIARQKNIEAWFLGRNLTEIVEHFLVERQNNNGYARRTREEIAAIRGQVLGELRNLNGSSATAKWLGQQIGVDPEELKRKDLDVLVAEDKIHKYGKGMDAVYSCRHMPTEEVANVEESQETVDISTTGGE